MVLDFFRYLRFVRFLLQVLGELGDGSAEAETEAAPDAEGGGAGLALLLDKVAQVLRLRNSGQCLNL